MEANNKTWKEFSEKMEVNKKENQRLFCKVFRNRKKDKQVELEQIKMRKLLTESNKIQTRWKGHFEQLLKAETNASVNNENVEAEETDMEGFQETGKDSTEEEFIKAINKIINGKLREHD